MPLSRRRKRHKKVKRAKRGPTVDKYPDKTIPTLCPDCRQFKPLEKFLDKAFNKYARCHVCRKAAINRWLGAYYEKLKSDPVAQLAAIEAFDLKRPRRNKRNGHTFLNQLLKWQMAKNSLLVRIGLKEKQPTFDIVTYMARKVFYGRATEEEAAGRIADYYRRHPEYDSSDTRNPANAEDGTVSDRSRYE